MRLRRITWKPGRATSAQMRSCGDVITLRGGTVIMSAPLSWVIRYVGDAR